MGYESKRKALYGSGLSILAASRTLDTRVGEKEESVVHPCISSLPPPLGLLLDTQSRSLLVIIVLHRLVLFALLLRLGLSRTRHGKKNNLTSCRQATTHCLVPKARLGSAFVQSSKKKKFAIQSWSSQVFELLPLTEMCCRFMRRLTIDYYCQSLSVPHTDNGRGPLVEETF